MNENNNLPRLQKAEEILANTPQLLKERNWYGTDTTGLLLDFAEPYTPPKWTLSHNGVPFAKLGDLHVVSGKAGHGKTAFMSQIIATILCGQCGGMRLELDSDKKPIVLYIDTEMGKDDTISVKNRICTLANMDYSIRSNRFYVARLRETVTALDRYKQILQLLWEIKPTVVFIDGLLDIVEDYNKQEECVPIIRELMVVSTFYNMSTWCVLHENPMTEKLVGTLGSIAQRKVTEVFTIRKHKGPHKNKEFKDFPNIFFEVVQTKARGKDQEDWYFEITDSNKGWGMPQEIGEFFKTKHTIKEIQQWVNDRISDVEWPATRTDFYNNILVPEGIVDEDEQKEIVNLAIKEKLLILQEPEEMGPKQRVPRLKFNDDFALPF